MTSTFCDFVEVDFVELRGWPSDTEGMKGCRPLADPLVPAVLAELEKSRSGVRDATLVTVGIRTGFRISELLSLRLGDVWQGGRVVDVLTVERRNMKGKKDSRSVPLHEEARRALERHVRAMLEAGHSDPATPLFLSRQGTMRPLTRFAADKIIRKALAACGVTGKRGTHTMRKTFSRRMKRAVGNDYHALQKLMGHKQITSTMSYDEVDEDKLVDAVLKS